MISIRNVTKYFAKITAVDNVTLEIPQGAFTALLGVAASFREMK